jgi:uncharacterized membrane protein HdeD (DUF308 family)
MSILLGLAMVVVGLVAMTSASTSGPIAVRVIGAALGVAGLIELSRSMGGGNPVQPFRLLGGLLSLLVGALLLFSPAGGVRAASVLVTVYFVVSGAFACITALYERPPAWGWEFAYGIAALVIGVIAVTQLPALAMWLIGVLVGLEILLRGVVIAGDAFWSRRPIALEASH